MRPGIDTALAIAAAALIALTACRSAHSPAIAGFPSPPSGTRFTEDALRESFASHASILAGFDAPKSGERDWRIGDRALYGIRLDDGEDGEDGDGGDGTHVWFVLAAVASDPVPHGQPIVFEAGPERQPTMVTPGRTALTFTFPGGEKVERGSESIAFEVTVFDASGSEIGRSFVGAPARFLREGFHSSCLRARSWPAVATAGADQQRAMAEDTITVITSLFGFLETFEQSPFLESMRTRIAGSTLEKPSIFSAIFGVHLSINPNLGTTLDESRPLPARRVGDAAIKLTTTLSLNDSLAMALDLVVVDPAPPFRVVGGVIGFEAAHPSHPERRFAARLLAAKRGLSTGSP
jgi:hypothetical protein